MDKQAHAGTGAAISLYASEIARQHGSKHPALWGFGCAVGAGMAKELIDRRRAGNHFDVADLGATASGGLLTFSVRW